MKMKEILMQWIGENKEDRKCLMIGYIGGITCPAFAYVYYILLTYLGVLA